MIHNFLLRITSLIIVIFSLQSCNESVVYLENENKIDTIFCNQDTIYDNVLTSQTAYISSLQLKSGAIRDTPYEASRICPYYSNITCLALLKNGTTENSNIVENYILWYISKLNGKVNPVTGKTEIPGSIYDYFGESEVTKGTYDSVDSYAATFLMLIQAYANVSEQNLAWLQTYRNRLSLVAEAMVKCIDNNYNNLPAGVFSSRDNDGLSISSYVYDPKFLMDNCEVNKGLKAAQWLKENNVISVKFVDLETCLTKQTASIESELWRETSYNWHDNNSLLPTSNWSVFYPDATAQLYPMLFNVIDTKNERSIKLYSQFNEFYPDWPAGKVYSGDYPWALVTYASAMMKDKSRVNQYIKHIYSYNKKNTQKEFWYSLEAAFTILAIHEIRQ